MSGLQNLEAFFVQFLSLQKFIIILNHFFIFLPFFLKLFFFLPLLVRCHLSLFLIPQVFGRPSDFFREFKEKTQKTRRKNTPSEGQLFRSTISYFSTSPSLYKQLPTTPFRIVLMALLGPAFMKTFSWCLM